MISSRIHKHIIAKFKSTYRCGHITETALLHVYNDIVNMAGKGNGSYLILLDLSAVFDTIDHYTDHNHYCLLDDFMSGVASLVCGCRRALFYEYLNFVFIYYQWDIF